MVLGHGIGNVAKLGCKRKSKKSTPRGVEPPPQNTGKTPIPETGGAKSGALLPEFVSIDPDLQRLVDSWPKLPEALRSGILAMIDAARK
jgi:hypothetical protein